MAIPAKTFHPRWILINAEYRLLVGMNAMQKVVNRYPDALQEGLWIVRVLLDIGAIDEAERLLASMTQLVESNPGPTKAAEVGRLRDILSERQEQERALGGGPHSLFDFQHPIVAAVRAVMDAALIRKGHLWIESMDGWLVIDLDELAPSFINVEHDEDGRKTTIEAILVQADGPRRPVRLRLPDRCAGPLGVLMATLHGARLIPTSPSKAAAAGKSNIKSYQEKYASPAFSPVASSEVDRSTLKSG